MQDAFSETWDAFLADFMTADKVPTGAKIPVIGIMVGLRNEY